jgi:hypothetical protein
MSLQLPIDPEGHMPIPVTLVSAPIRYAGVDEMGWESSREAVQCLVCRQDWPCDWLESKHPGLRSVVSGSDQEGQDR